MANEPEEEEVVEAEVEEEATGWHGQGRTPEHDTLIGIYQYTYTNSLALNDIRGFVNRVNFFFELIYYAVIGALAGWIIGSILKLF